MMIPDYIGVFLAFIMHDRIEEYEQQITATFEVYAGLEADYFDALEDYGNLFVEKVKLADELAEQKEYNQNLSDQLTLVTAQRDNSVDTIVKLTGDNIELANKLKAASKKKEELAQGFLRIAELADEYCRCSENAQSD